MSDASKDRISGTIDEAKGKVKAGVGDAADDRSTHAEGLLDQAVGKAKQGMAGAKDAIDGAVKNMTDHGNHSDASR